MTGFRYFDDVKRSAVFSWRKREGSPRVSHFQPGFRISWDEQGADAELVRDWERGPAYPKALPVRC